MQINAKQPSLLIGYEPKTNPFVIAGYIASRQNPKRADKTQSSGTSFSDCSEQMKKFQNQGTDLITVTGLISAEEAITYTRAAKAGGIPLAVSFQVDRYGRLPNGQALHYAIQQVDNTTGVGPAYYLIQCLNPKEGLKILRRTHAKNSRIKAFWVPGTQQNIVCAIQECECKIFESKPTLDKLQAA